MKQNNIVIAMDLLRVYSEMLTVNHPTAKSDDAKIMLAAQQELSVLTQLVDVVKGFIEDNEVREVGCVEGLNRGDMWVFVNDLCQIVGYKE